MRAPVRRRKKTRSISLPDKLWDFAKEVGNGEYSAGIRHILYITLEQTKVEAEQSQVNTKANSKLTTNR